METYYYDIRKQVFEYDEVMNNQRRAVYSERRRVLDGRALKKQVIGYGERTMNEIVEAYVNPDLPPEEWDLDQLTGKVKEFIYLLEDLTPEQVQGLGMEELKAFLQEQLRNAYDIKEGQVEQQRPGLMREAERFFILQQIDTLWREHLQAMDALRESVGLRGYGQKDPLIEYKNEGYDMFLDMMTNMRRNVIYSMFMFQPAAQEVKSGLKAVHCLPWSFGVFFCRPCRFGHCWPVASVVVVAYNMPRRRGEAHPVFAVAEI